jgi:hypothetical protein
MLGSRNALGQGWLVACTLALLGLSSCSGVEFTPNDGAGGTDASNAGNVNAGQDNGGSASGGSGGATTAGGSTSGGTSDVGGSSGVGGSVSGGCVCDDGYYCRDGSEDCFKCAELNRLHFATPERLATVSDNGQGSHFPRVGMTLTDLLYRFEGAGLRYTTDASTSAGANLKLTLATDSAPLLLVTPLAGIDTMTPMGSNFVFDREEGGLRSLYMGQWNNGLQQVERAPAPYNGDKNDYSMAIASKPTADSNARAFWMTDRGVITGMGVPSLVTALLLANAPAAPVNLKLGQEGCGATDADLAPWVTTDGKTLLVSHTRLDASCKPTGQGKDIYTALLQPATGLPTAAALPMSDVNSPMNDVEPSFSADLCDLYFASDRDGKYALYRAHRR